MKKKWKVILCIALAVVVLGGSLTAWLLYTPPDTDPDAPFQDLPNWEKREILVAVEKKLAYIGYEAFWYGDPLAGNSYYGGSAIYYGTFNGYHIVMATFNHTVGGSVPGHETIGEYTFWYDTTFNLFACKDGVAIWLDDAYEEGLISKEQLDAIFRCYQRYNEEVYVWSELEG